MYADKSDTPQINFTSAVWICGSCNAAKAVHFRFVLILTAVRWVIGSAWPVKWVFDIKSRSIDLICRYWYNFSLWLAKHYIQTGFCEGIMVVKEDLRAFVSFKTMHFNSWVAVNTGLLTPDIFEETEDGDCPHRRLWRDYIILLILVTPGRNKDSSALT